jgi:hypothetical protein
MPKTPISEGIDNPARPRYRDILEEIPQKFSPKAKFLPIWSRYIRRRIVRVVYVERENLYFAHMHKQYVRFFVHDEDICS